METTFLTAIEVIGTIAFAISGIRLAAFRRFDWFGAYTVGLVTAIGGGTLRDILLDIPVFWMQTFLYLGVTGISLAVVILFRKMLVSNNRMLFVQVGDRVSAPVGVHQGPLYESLRPQDDQG